MSSSWTAPPHRALQHPYKDTVAVLPAVGNASFAGSPTDLVRNDRPGRARQGVSERSLGDRSVQRALPVTSSPWLFACGGDEVCGTDGGLCGQEIRASRKQVLEVSQPHKHPAGIGAVLIISASGEVVFNNAVDGSAAWDAMRQGHLRGGDIIMSVDGQPVYRAPVRIIASTLQGAPGSYTQVSFKRGAQIVTLRLERRVLNDQHARIHKLEERRPTSSTVVTADFINVEAARVPPSSPPAMPQDYGRDEADLMGFVSEQEVRGVGRHRNEPSTSEEQERLAVRADEAIRAAQAVRASG